MRTNHKQQITCRLRYTFYSQKKIHMGFLLAFFIPLLFFSACKKERIKLEWEEQTTPTTDLLTRVHFADALRGYVVGGDSWYHGLYLYTEDGGQNWVLDTLGPKLLFGLHFREEMAYAIGIEGNFFIKKDQASGWEQRSRQGWKTWRAVDFYDAENGILVGGEAFQSGYIRRIDGDYNLVALDTFPHEMSAVCFSDAETVHAVGYGAVLRSVDGGMTWEYSSIRGDFYRDVCFPTAQTGYAVGSVGSIIKTRDAGASWELLRNGNKVTVADKFFRAVYFKDELKGYIVGDGGIFWRTEDGGVSWQVVEGLPDVDFYDVTGTDFGGYIVGEGGKVFRFVD